MNIVLFTCEPGGAMVMITVINLLRERLHTVTLLTYGLAEARFERKSIPFRRIGVIRDGDCDIIERYRPDWIITSAASLPNKDMSEKHLWMNAKTKNVRTLALLDQWQNYAIRFSGSDSSSHLRYLPDYINCINATGRKEMIEEGFPEGQLLAFGHPYLSSVRSEARAVDRNVVRARMGINHLVRVYLFVSEAIREYFGDTRGYDQFDALRLLLKSIMKWRGPRPVIIVKLHPKESRYSVDAMRSESPSLRIIVVSDELTPLECILSSDVVVGMTSLMLIEAYLLGKPVLSLQPNLKVPNPFVLSRHGHVQVIVSDQDDVPEQLSASTRQDFDVRFNENIFCNLIEKGIVHQ